MAPRRSLVLIVLVVSCVLTASAVRAGVVVGPLHGPVVLANPAQSPVPLAGFTPMVVMGMTDATHNLNDYDTMQQPTLIGTPYSGGAAPYYAVVLLDSGANVFIMSHADRTGFGLPATEYTFTAEGAGPGSVTGDIMASAGIFAAGVQTMQGGSANPASFRGVSNVRVLASQSAGSAQHLPSVVGMPMMAFYTTVISTERTYNLTHNGQAHTTPGVDFYTSRYDPGVPTNLDYRLQTTYYQPEALPPVFMEPIVWEFPPATPTVSGALLIEGVSASHTVTQTRTTGGNFLFDTGAQVTVLSVDRALDLGLDLANPEFTVEITGVGGTLDAVPGYTIDTLTLPATGLGDMVLHDVPIIVLNVPNDNQPLDGIIGMNLFNDRDLVIHAGYGGSTWGGPFIGVTASHAWHLPGDANRDGVVNTDDLGVLLSQWGLASGAAWSDGDFDRNGRVNTDDLGKLLSRWGTTAVAVPEPTSLGLLAIGALALGRRRTS